MFPIILTTLLILQTLLIFFVPFNVYAELSLFPWLVSSGFMPYRDFFDHHGFLLYYILAPFSNISGGVGLFVFYLFLQSVNLILIVIILRRLTHGIYIFLFSFLYLLLNFFFSENNFWYEQAITTGFLISLLLLLDHRVRLKPYLLGIAIAGISFIKPTAAVLLIPVFSLHRNKNILVSFISSWMIVLFLFWINGGLPQIVNGLFSYNHLLYRTYPGHPLGDIRLIWFSALLLFCALPALFFSQKKSTPIGSGSTGIILVGFILCSFIFLRLSYGKEHFTPLVAMFILFLAWAITQYNKPIRRIGTVLIVVYTVFLLQQIKHLNAQLITNRTADTLKREALIASVRPFMSSGTSLYVFGDLPKLYYSLRVFPVTYYPADFPIIESFDPNYESRVLDALKKKNVDTILEPLPQQDRYLRMQNIRSFIQTNFRAIYQTDQVMLYKRE